MEISELKARLCILDVARHLGIEYDPKTKKAICPFHDDKNPSLQFSKEKQIATCFSTNCDAGTMDMIDLTEKMLKVSKHEAIKWLSELAGELPAKKEAPKAKKPAPDYAKDFEQMRSTLLSSSTGRNYAISRKLDRRRVDMGFNPHTGKFGYLRGFLVFPLLDKQGKVVSLYGRNVRKNGTYRHHYTTDREGFYPCYPKQETERLILTECIIDAATLLSIPAISENYGILSLYGARVWSKEQGEALKSLPFLKEVIMFLDDDEAGREGMAKQAKHLMEELPEVALTAVDTLEGEDINSIAQSHEPEVFGKLLEGRKPYSFPIEDSGERKVDMEKITGFKLDTSNPKKLVMVTENAIYMVMGGLRCGSDSLKVSLHIVHPTSKARSRGRVELYEDRQVAKAAKDAAEKLFIRVDLIEQDMDILVDLVDGYRDSLEGSAEDGENGDGKPKPLTKMQREECVSFLSLPRLTPRMNGKIGMSGIVGEETNRICVFVIASSYKMPSTMHALIQGSTGSGKTHLMDAIIELMPPECCIRLTRVTEASFYNYGRNELTHKLIGLEDFDGLEEKAELALRELQSSGRISSGGTVQGENGGRGQTEIHWVEGPIASLAATTRGEIYEDNMSRCFLIAVDESQEQTLRIIRHQNDRAAGLVDKEKEKEAREFLRNCMRVLKPYEVVNPYANKIELPREAHKIRRLNDLFQSFVCQITLLHQFQRKKDAKGRLVTEKEDIREAIDIMFESIVLKVDELDGSLRAFYEDLKAYVREKGKEYEFGRLEIRKALNIGNTQLHRHMAKLMSLEYVRQSGGHANRGFRYRIKHWDDNAKMRAGIKAYLERQLEKL